MSTSPSDHPFTSDLFERMDESDDALFYAVPRRVVHLDAPGLAAVRRFFAETLPPRAVLLDLMSGWRSHLPATLAPAQVVGVGLNAEEMDDNPDLDQAIVHDLNADPRLPFEDESFDAALLSVSMQYLTRPIEVFRDVRRVLRPGGVFLVVLSHRCFAAKAVKIWHQCQTMRERMELAMAYFRFAGGFTELLGVDLRPGATAGEDPVVAVVAKRESGAAPSSPRGAGWRRR